MTKEQLKLKIQIIKYFFLDIFGWIHSLWIYCFRSIKIPGIFYGYCAYYWASKYAEKRTKNWDREWDQAGKKQGVLPLSQDKLITCSAMELKAYKKAKLVSNNIKPRKLIKKSYYTTEL
jgi:hypothetical protein